MTSVSRYTQTEYLEINPQRIFSRLERISTLEKWQEVPRIFLRDYELSLNQRPGKALKELITRRNALIHYKPRVKNALSEIQGNSKFDIEKYREKVKILEEFLKLPKDLLKHIYKYEQSSNLIEILSDSIALSAEDKEEILKSSASDNER